MGHADHNDQAGTEARAEAQHREEGEHVVTFSYDPAEITPLDVIRGMAVDTTDPGIVADETYEAVMASYGVVDVDTAPFYRAAANILRRVAVAIARQPTSVAATGDGSIGWAATRTKELTDLADALDAKADAIDGASGGHWTSRVTVRSRFLTNRRGAETW